MPIVIHPLNRGLKPLKIVLHNHGTRIKAAEVGTTYYWDQTKILRGNDPLDATQLAQRASGVDFIAHAVAAARAVEEIAQVKIPANARVIRNILLGLDIIYGHLTHFYHTALPDYIPYPGMGTPKNRDDDYRVPSDAVQLITTHIWRSYEVRRTIHGLMALMGGKAPHVCNIMAGGVTRGLSETEFIKAKSMLKEISDFINKEYSYDLWQIKQAYGDYFYIGRGEGRLLTVGEFPQQENAVFYITPRVQTETGTENVNENLMTVEYATSFFEPEISKDNLLKTRYKPVPGRAGGYSWVKGIVYNKMPYETGALARMLLSGNKTINELGKGAISVMGRYRARLEESTRLIEQMAVWLDELNLKERTMAEFEVPETGEAISYAEASGGAVVHYVSLKKGKIDNYNIFDSYSWNVCPTTKEGYRNVIEQALMGIELPLNGHVPVYRVARSF